MRRFAQAYWDTDSTIPVIMRLDNDDPRLNDYPRLWTTLINRPVGLAAAQNEMFQAFPNEQVYGFLADDAVPRTWRWDQRLARAAMEHGIAYPNDLYGTADHDKRHNHFFIRGDLLRAVGCFAPLGFYHLFVDDVWMAIGDALGIGTYLDDVIIEHVHFGNGKAEYDDTYKRHGLHFEEDKAAFEKWRQEDLDKWLLKLKSVIAR